MSAEASDRVKLKALLQDRPWTGPFKSGAIGSDVVDFAFDDVAQASSRFKPMVRDLAYDCGELAIVTYLQAKYYGKPLVLLPFVVFGNFHHKSITYNTDRGALTPQALAGRRVGVRTYTQTTGVWVRGILHNEYGVDLDAVTWVTFDDAHLAEYTDPKNCARAPARKKLIEMLLDGELDAAILAANMPSDPKLKPLIPDPDRAEKAWADKYGFTPINHMFVVTRALCRSRPDVVREIFRMLVEARGTTPSPFPSGLDGNWKALELVGEYAFQQGIVPRRYSLDELFADAAAVLGH
jgi:4,5-dihydroxyphthalate decarboxylase